MMRYARRSAMLVLVLVFAIQGLAASAATANVSIYDDYFSPKAVKVSLGSTVTWTNQGDSHTVTSSKPLGLWDSGNKDFGQVFSRVFTAAGKYSYLCKYHSGMVGTVTVPMKASPASGVVGTTFTITAASVNATAPWVYDIQIKRPGALAFTNWKAGITAKSAAFATAGLPTGTYQFKARLRNPVTGKTTDYSPVKSITVS